VGNASERILITGAAGWVGSCLVERSGGRDVLAASRDDLDCTSREDVDSTIRSVSPGTVVHLAGSTAHRLDPYAAELHWRDTVLAGRNVLAAAAEAGVPHVIAAGTMEELGDAAGTLGVDLPPRPRTQYGLCKSLVHQVAGFVARTSEVRVDWFRPCTVYGPGQRGPMLVPSACESAMSGKPMSFTDGRQRRDFLFVDDLIGWITMAIDARPEPNGDVNVHHLGTGTPVPVADVIAFIAEALPAARFEVGALPRRPHEPAVQVAPQCPSADPVLGAWRARVTWREGLRLTTEWWLTQAG
jgi:nucleoside-diphosphate-sugar epimerase